MPDEATALSPAEVGRSVRLMARADRTPGHTAGLAPGNLQGNLVILPSCAAADFEAFCRANPAPCPLIAISEPGAAAIPTLGEDIDVRCDLPAYRVWREGVLAAEVTQIAELWQEDLVTFVIGCSFSFEAALAAGGIPIRHVEEGRNVPMYITALDTNPVGPFGGPMVVTMRPVAADQVEKAAAITAAVPMAHGAPLHAGDPAKIGIADLSRPDFGEPTRVLPGEVPVFWACGVTPHVALRRAKLPLAITHRPGAMLVTDLPLKAA